MEDWKMTDQMSALVKQQDRIATKNRMGTNNLCGNDVLSRWVLLFPQPCYSVCLAFYRLYGRGSQNAEARNETSFIHSLFIYLLIMNE